MSKSDTILSVPAKEQSTQPGGRPSQRSVVAKTSQGTSVGSKNGPAINAVVGRTYLRSQNVCPSDMFYRFLNL